MTKIFKPERIPISKLDGISEKSIQEMIADDPSIIGLGDLVLKDKERIQPRAGRLDLLMQDPDTNRRYEIELQLGKTDESHIIRTIEYWDIDRKGTRLNSSHVKISYAVFCLKKKKTK